MLAHSRWTTNTESKNTLKRDNFPSQSILWCVTQSDPSSLCPNMCQYIFIASDNGIFSCSFCESIFPMLLIFGLILRKKATYFLHLKVKVVVHWRRWLLIPDSSIEFFIETTNRTVKKVFQELGRAIRYSIRYIVYSI